MGIKYDNVYSVVGLTEHASESALGPIKTQIAGPCSQYLIQQVWSTPRICISNKFPGDTDHLFRKHIENC